MDLAYGVPGLGRFRVNVFQQRGTLGAVLRVIPFKVMTIRDLMLPPVLEKIALEERGLVLVTGTTGSGKSTTLAAMIDHINANETNHIMTIEDPIEFLIRDKRSIVNQREVGVDTVSFSQALKSALRQDPDVILVGEMRDLETIETALTAAETGHLVMSTLHTLDATETINRIVSVFPPYQQKQVRMQLGTVLRAVISQRLVPRADGKGRVAAVEVLKATARVRELIEDKDRTKEIPDAIAQGHQTYGMQTFDQSLMNLVRQSVITYDEALPAGHQPGRLRAALQRHQRHQRQQVGRLRRAPNDGELSAPGHRSPSPSAAPRRRSPRAHAGACGALRPAPAAPAPPHAPALGDANGPPHRHAAAPGGDRRGRRLSNRALLAARAPLLGRTACSPGRRCRRAADGGEGGCRRL